ncbi:MAG TPA: tetratricopeptide repeat protein [Candidatus Obscuribacterales bacterium]
MKNLTRSGGRKPALAAIALAAGFVFPASVLADAISPAIKPTGKVYSKEKPDVSMYGTGVGGRYMEASMLRFEIDRHLQDGEYDKAIQKSRKACQLDPGDPETHMLLAKALTQKLEQTKGKIDEKLLVEAMGEWRLLWLHNADQSEQLEAKLNFMRMKLVARGLAKQHQLEEKAKLKTQQTLAEKKAQQEQEAGSDGQKNQSDKTGNDGKDKAAAANKTNGGKSADTATDQSADAEEPAANSHGVEIAHKHKRFIVF